MGQRNDLITVICFLLVIAFFSAAFIIMPDRERSEQENRPLAQMPELTADSLFSGQLSNEINVYYADQMPFRAELMGVRSTLDYLLCRGETGGVLIGKDGQLAVRYFDAYKSILLQTEDTDFYYKDSVIAQADALSSWAESSGLEIYTVIPPRTVDVAVSNLVYTPKIRDELHGILSERLDGAGYIDLLPIMTARYDNGEYVYYKTDHHWTTYGAYLAYTEIMKAMGCKQSIVPMEDFAVEQITDFYGTTDAKSLLPFTKADTLELWTLGDEAEYTVIADGEDIGGFYSRAHLDTRDKYAVFLDGTHGVVTVTKNGESRKKLLVAKDSFADCLIPFLAREFDIVAVNMESATSLTALAEYYGCDTILIVYNAENVVTNGTLGKIR